MFNGDIYGQFISLTLSCLEAIQMIAVKENETSDFLCTWTQSVNFNSIGRLS